MSRIFIFVTKTLQSNNSSVLMEIVEIHECELP